VLSAFFVGYACSQVAGGRLADRFSGTAVLPMAVASWSLATLLTPAAAAGGLGALLAARLALGAAEGPAFPAAHALIASAVPTHARVGVLAPDYPDVWAAGAANPQHLQHNTLRLLAWRTTSSHERGGLGCAVDSDWGCDRCILSRFLGRLPLLSRPD
jgi:hypothetical protein